LRRIHSKFIVQGSPFGVKSSEALIKLTHWILPGCPDTVGTNAMVLDPDSCVQVSANAYARAFGDEVVVLHFGEGAYFGLDEVGAQVWALLERGEPLRAIAEAIAKRYEVSQETALRDVVNLVADLAKHELVLPR
jgi:hypothetical protein